MKIIEQLKFRFTGKNTPVFKVQQIDENDHGRILMIQDLGKCQDNPNTLLYAWENLGYTKEKGTYPITRIDEKGNKDLIYFVNAKGETANLYSQPWKGPANEKVIGSLLSVDIIAIAMGLYPSMRDKMIFMLIGILLGWWIIGPMMGTILS